ncbi:MAG: NAD(P)-dependent alcohol dehydrogenase [Candidatus Hodarchaeales archaeon]|jgi:NADPH:quinone reductase-like Zn-dependent oxidoreductase
MKAIVCEEFGSADVLELKEIEKPIPKDNEVLIRNHASAMQALDITFRSGRKVLSGLFRIVATGIRKPRKKVVGLDFSGEVVSVGKKVTNFKEGDQVYGGTTIGGACAEYMRVPSSSRTAIKPANMSFQEAAAVVGGAVPALTALKDLATIQSGQKVLINGASGGIGTFAVQIAKNVYETEVTGVCGTSNLNMVSDIGADFVIDYTKEDFTKNGQIYDVIFDAVGKNSFSNCKNSLSKKGIYVTSDFYNPKKQLLQLITSKFTSKKIKGGMLGNFEDLNLLRDWIEEGKIKSVIEKVYPLDQTADAHRHYETGHAKGRIVIAID